MSMLRLDKVEIREMKKKDLDLVVSLIRDTYDNEQLWLDYTKKLIKEDFLFMLSLFNKKKYKVYVAIVHNEIIGVASLSFSDMTDSLYELSWCTVLPKFQRQGIGTLLTTHRLNYIRGLNYPKYVMVSTRYPKLFKKFGFVELLKRDDDASHSSFCYLKL